YLRVLDLVLNDLVQQWQQRLASTIHDFSADLNDVDIRQDSDHRRLGGGNQVLVDQRLTHEQGRNVVAVTAAAVAYHLPSCLSWDRQCADRLRPSRISSGARQIPQRSGSSRYQSVEEECVQPTDSPPKAYRGAFLGKPPLH